MIDANEPTDERLRPQWSPISAASSAPDRFRALTNNLLERWVRSEPSKARGEMSVTGLILFLAFAAVVAFGWATDRIRPQGERAVYTVDCAPGTWEGNKCFGVLVAGRQLRFRTVAARREVQFWTVGSPAVSGKYSDCKVQDAENWSCRADAQTPNFIVHQMIGGHPVTDPGVPTLPFHEIQKWRWLLLRAGVPVGHEAL